jgi:D-alanine-D-alanine ligase
MGEQMPGERKIRVAVLFGGKSAEHEVSLLSARNVVNALDKERFEVSLVGIDKLGRWHRADASQLLTAGDGPKLVALEDGTAPLSVDLGAGTYRVERDSGSLGSFDVAFPVLHGPFGEDGSIQGLLKVAGIPFVGSGVLGSAVGMDKDVMKRLLREAGIPVGAFVSFRAHQRDRISFEALREELGVPFFVKPANLGSSVGIRKVGSERELEAALDLAFSFDRKVLVEANIAGRELECAVLGNDHARASVVGEVVTNTENHGFYSYEAKYLDEQGAVLEIPARLPEHVARRVQRLALETCSCLCAEGMARVDFFLRPDGEVLVNEINTLPGFTSMSMYPKLWEASGKGYSDLVGELVELALERHRAESKLKTSVE